MLKKRVVPGREIGMRLAKFLVLPGPSSLFYSGRKCLDTSPTSWDSVFQ